MHDDESNVRRKKTEATNEVELTELQKRSSKWKASRAKSKYLSKQQKKPSSFPKTANFLRKFVFKQKTQPCHLIEQQHPWESERFDYVTAPFYFAEQLKQKLCFLRTKVFYVSFLITKNSEEARIDFFLISMLSDFLRVFIK